MLGAELITALNAGYVCPPQAGPAWRQAAAEGIDMSLVEQSLGKSPWVRLLDHDQALGFALKLRMAGPRPHE